MCVVPAGAFSMFSVDTRVCSYTHVRLLDHLEAYGVGGIMATRRCKGVSWRGGGGAAKLGGRVCDVVVTPCDVRSLEIQRPRNGTLLLL